MNRWNVQIILESLNHDSVFWVLTDQGLAALRAEVSSGELGNARLGRIEPLREIGLVSLPVAA